MQKFQDRKENSAMQYILDIKDILHSLDNSLCLFSNALNNHEMVESCLFIHQKKKLIGNKGREEDEQESHFQAETINFEA